MSTMNVLSGKAGNILKKMQYLSTTDFIHTLKFAKLIPNEYRLIHWHDKIGAHSLL